MAQGVDAVVIGTGQSGPSLAHRLAAAGRRVAIVERKRFGGTCVNNGCIPTKSLIASARAAHVARRAADFGVLVEGTIRVDMKAVKARKDAIVKVSNEGVEEGLREAENITVLTGHARFAGPREVAVGDTLLSADQVFINVGGRAGHPADPGPRPGTLSRQLLDDGRRLPARASRDPRRQLYRAGVRPDVPALRQRGHDRPAQARQLVPQRGPGHRPGDPRDPRGRGHPRPDRRRGDAGRGPRRRDRGERHGRRKGERGRGLAPPGRDRAAAQHRRSRPRGGRRRDGRAGLHQGRQPAAHQRAGHLRARRLQRPRRVHPHLVQRLRDRRGQPVRGRASAASRIAFGPTACSSTRRSAAPA